MVRMTPRPFYLRHDRHVLPQRHCAYPVVSALQRFGKEDAPLWLTVSLGFCRYPLRQECQDSFWNLSFKLADMALYQAKVDGRNRWCGYAGNLSSREEMCQTPEQLAEEGDFTLLHSANQD